MYRKKTDEPQVEAQVEQYSIILREAINLKQTGGLTDVADALDWHSCNPNCSTVDTNNLYYKYLNQEVCPLMPSRWMWRNIQDLSDSVSTVITEREEPYNPSKDKLAVIEYISSDQPCTTIIKDLKNKMKQQKLNLDLSIRVYIQQLVIDINSYLRNLQRHLQF